MKTFQRCNKRYERVTPRQLLSFIHGESRDSTHDLCQYETMTVFDLRQDVCFLVYIDSTVVGFATAKPLPDARRQLTKLYITPRFRRYGCGTYILRCMKITDVAVPKRYPLMDALVSKMGFHLNTPQHHPKSLTEYSRTTFEAVNHVAHR